MKRVRFIYLLLIPLTLLLNGCDEDGGDQKPTAGELPCDVQAIVEQHCSNCHGAVPRFGGPMPLVTADDWHVPAITDPTETMYHIARERMNYSVDQSPDLAIQHVAFGPMPPAPNPVLNAEELAVMNNWIDGGALAKAGADSCDLTRPEIDKPEPIPEVNCIEHKFLAHADDQMDVPFHVGEARDAYYNFTFLAPWTKPVYAKVIKPVIDNDRALHHWLLYKKIGTLFRHGSVQVSTGAHVGGQLINGWAPGGDPHYYGEDLGRLLEPGYYNLEIHYNSDDPDAYDTSGISICYVEEEPEKVAELVWLGTDAILGREASATCVPENQTEPIHILSVTPHMHVKGRHMKSVINRVDGTKEILHDQPFNFDSQVTWNFKKDVIIYPGDTITTTCTYSEPAIFGRGTNAEMCYLYTTAWPIGALRDNKLLSLIHGPNTCLGLLD